VRAGIVLNRTSRGGVSDHLSAIANGLARHGISVSYLSGGPDHSLDFIACWGWRKAKAIKDAGFDKPVLVLERGYIGDRLNVWTSLGWDGLNGRARFPEPQDGGERFWENHGHLAKEWERFDGYWLIAGQVLGDQSLLNVNYLEWLRDTVDELDRMGVDARFRPHPEAVKRQQEFPVPSYMVSTGTLEEDLSEAACVIAYNSNATVDAVLAGIPAITCDEGAMAWDVTSHHALQGLVTPDRTEWFRRMAWTQWTIEEISDGSAWAVVRTAM
jgi:hypothetical protein